MRLQGAGGARMLPIPVTGDGIAALPADVAMIERLDLVAECEVPHWVPRPQPGASEAPRAKGERAVYWRRGE